MIYDKKKLLLYFTNVESSFKESLSILEMSRHSVSISRMDSSIMKFYLQEYSRFTVRVCEHLIKSNTLYGENLNDSDVLYVAGVLGFISREESQVFLELLTLSDIILHEYWIDSLGKVLCLYESYYHILGSFIAQTKERTTSGYLISEVDIWIKSLMIEVPDIRLTELGRTLEAQALNLYLYTHHFSVDNTISKEDAISEIESILFERDKKSIHSKLLSEIGSVKEED